MSLEPACLGSRLRSMVPNSARVARCAPSLGAGDPGGGVMAADGMRLMWSAILRRVREAAGAGVFVLVKVPGAKGSPPDLLADVEAAISAATTEHEDRSNMTPSPDVIPSAKGPLLNIR